NRPLDRLGEAPSIGRGCGSRLLREGRVDQGSDFRVIDLGKMGSDLVLHHAAGVLPDALRALVSADERLAGFMDVVAASLFMLVGGFTAQWEDLHAEFFTTIAKEYRQVTDGNPHPTFGRCNVVTFNSRKQLKGRLLQHRDDSGLGFGL